MSPTHVLRYEDSAAAAAGLLTLMFRGLFILYGKSNRIFTKKIGAVACRPA